MYYRKTIAENEEWNILFPKLKKQFSDSLITRDILDDEKKINEEILEELYVVPLAGSFCVKPISFEEYQEATKDIGYGIHIG